MCETMKILVKRKIMYLAAGAVGNLSSACAFKTYSVAFTPPGGAAIAPHLSTMPTREFAPVCTRGVSRCCHRSKEIPVVSMLSGTGLDQLSRTQWVRRMLRPNRHECRQHEHSRAQNPPPSGQRAGYGHQSLSGKSLAAAVGTARLAGGSKESTVEPDGEESQWSFMFKASLGLLDRLRRKVAAIPEGAADEGRFLATAAFIGVLTGTAVTAFKILIGLIKEKSYGDLLSLVPAEAAKYAVGMVPVLGAMGVVSLMWILRLKSYGPGLGGLTEEVDKQVPWSPKRTLGKTLAAVSTLGTGNSLGPEGPAVELGVAASRWAASASKLSVERQRMLLGAGAAAGVAAGFNAPIAGVFFALEIVKNTFNSNVNSKSFIAGTLLCSVVSALIAKIGLHDELALRPAAYHLESPLVELPLYLGLGVVAGLVAVMFKFFSRKSGDLFAGNMVGFRWMKRVPKWSKPIIMAAITGLIGIGFPQVLFFGYDTLDNLLLNTGDYGIGILGFLCVAKALLTAGALGSGLVGGTFAPSLFLGATAGAAYQEILQGSLTALKSAAGPSLETLGSKFPAFVPGMGLVGSPGGIGSLLTIAGPPAYAMVGAAAVLSALYRAPLTGSLLLFELTMDYDIVLPLMAAAGVSSLVVELLSLPDGETMTPTPPPMPRDMSLEIGLKTSGKVDELMGKVQVSEALEPRVLALTSDASLQEAMDAFRDTHDELAVVVSPEKSDGMAWRVQTFLAKDMWGRRDLKLVGVLALREILSALELERSSSKGDKARPELTAGSVCRRESFTVEASSDIATARSVMDSKGVRFLPVIVESGMPEVMVPSSSGGGQQASHTTATSTEGPHQPAVVGMVSSNSVRIAGRLAETERALQKGLPAVPVELVEG